MRIQVHNLNETSIFERDITDNEYLQFRDHSGKSPAFRLTGLFLPTRTNNLRNFSKDFFLPTMVNYSRFTSVRLSTIRWARFIQKINLFVGIVFVNLLSLAIDVLTFPMRLLTCIPQVISNSRKEEDILRKFLKSNAADRQLIEADGVYVRFLEEGNIFKRNYVSFIQEPLSCKPVRRHM